LIRTKKIEVGQVINKVEQTQTPTLGQKNPIVSMSTQEEVVRTFFNLVSEKKVPEAVVMLSQKAASDDSTKQAWAAHLATFESIQVEKIERLGGDTFRVDLKVQVSQEGANASVPYYGWSNGKNTRWVKLAKEKESWKIDELATGL